MKKETYEVSIRCYYPNGEPTTHRQILKLSDIAKWIEAYKFTHPVCEAVTVKVWFNNNKATT